MNEAALWVYYEDHRVGRADLHEGDRLSFVYDSDWLAYGGAFALSQSLPLVDGEVNADRLRPRHFEALAEGWDMRPALATRELERLLGQRKRAWETALAALQEHIEYSPAVESVERAMEKRARALENNLRQDRP